MEPTGSSIPGSELQLTPESLRPLIGHPTLRSGIWGFGSFRKNIAA
jgi:hypothetical protein